MPVRCCEAIFANVRVTAPYFDAKATDPVERFVAEARRHPVFKLSTDPSPG